jgi:hypothetical protein
MHASKRSQRLILEGVCASWAAQDFAAVRACIHRDAVYQHHLPAGAWPMHGIVRGKQEILGSLSGFLQDFDVIQYRPLKIVPDGEFWDLRVAFEYGHKLTGHTLDGTARIKTLIDLDKVRLFEVIHDAPRLRAFFELVSRMSIEA